MKRVALYARVSTDGQTTENQLRELRETAKRHGWEITGEFIDRGISGAKGKEGRPQFNALHTAIARKECDLVAAWSVDRLGRSLKDLVDFLGQVHAKGIGLYLHQQGLDTTTPAGKALFGMMGVFAEFERAMIQERVKAGLSRAKANGTRLGRPPLAASADGLKVQRRVLDLRKSGLGMCAIAEKVGISSRTVMKIVAATA
ncbi:recombinase family protein [Nitrospira lenta]|uniref:Resolvase domain n=1 Tax=Nitrospira lenta TaxID=1436998 RepID=A0A330L5V3_9BACT|nr:recombinase family protein [Nitrospira lenta]SPP65222.1 Resolvase domain [Nitrospira lenta]